MRQLILHPCEVWGQNIDVSFQSRVRWFLTNQCREIWIKNPLITKIHDQPRIRYGNTNIMWLLAAFHLRTMFSHITSFATQIEPKYSYVLLRKRKCYVLLTVHLEIIYHENQPDALFILNLFPSFPLAGKNFLTNKCCWGKLMVWDIDQRISRHDKHAKHFVPRVSTPLFLHSLDGYHDGVINIRRQASCPSGLF
jgi:hypothetical protein